MAASADATPGDHIQIPDDSIASLMFTTLDAFLTLATEILEEYDRDMWNQFRAKRMVQ